jgi:hypothetical protein
MGLAAVRALLVAVGRSWGPAAASAGSLAGLDAVENKEVVISVACPIFPGGPLYYLPKCWPLERRKRAEEFPAGLFPVLFAELLNFRCLHAPSSPNRAASCRTFPSSIVAPRCRP